MNDPGGVFNGDGLHVDRSAIIPGHPAALLRSPMSTWEAARGALAELERLRGGALLSAIKLFGRRRSLQHTTRPPNSFATRIRVALGPPPIRRPRFRRSMSSTQAPAAASPPPRRCSLRA
jgi:hypothetical protein